MLVRSAGHEGLFHRIEAELKIAGFWVREKEYLVVPAESQIETALRIDSALIFIRELTRSIELYYRTTDGRMIHLTVPLPLSAEEEEVTSLHIVEVLRVAFPEPTPASAPMPEPVVRSTETPHSALDKIVGLLAAGGVFERLNRFPQLGLQLGVGYQFHPWFAVQLDADVPIRGLTLSETEGDARLLCSGIGLSVQAVVGTSRIRPVVRLGYRVWFVHSAVQPESGYDATESTEVTTGPVFFAGVATSVAGRLAFTLGFSVSPTVSKLRYEMNDRTVAALGRPLYGISLGLLWMAKERQK
ncbi:MAG: hypothetical protein JXX29_20300 [Deltaproteobacteria bacterium]|nr:hypothetical protein [Deltaproteobacteria bacterium]